MRGAFLLLATSCALLSTAWCECENGWRPYDNRCYFFSPSTLSWNDAREDCETNKNGNLMSITHLSERDWARTQVGGNIYWIGLNDIAEEGVWEWTDGAVWNPIVEYWRPNQPDNWQGNEHCGQLDTSGRWNDEGCGVRRRYICKRENPNPPVVCDEASGWQQYQSNCYKLRSNLRKSWLQARTDCVTEGGDLVSITSAEEEQYVTSRLDTNQFDLWIGFSTMACTTLSCQVQPDSTTFGWSDANPSTSYTNWGNNQPDQSDKANGLCTAVIKDTGEEFGRWKTHVCRQQRPYMCKRGLNTICPAGWLSFAGNCYWVVSNPNLLTTWNDALTKCTDMGANLVTIKNAEEQFYINAQLPDFHQVEIPDIWIGLSDKDQDGNLQWVDKTSVEYSNWRSGFPVYTEDMWDCGQIYTGNYNGEWETTTCNKRLGYICKMAGGQNIKPTSAPDSHCDQGYLLYGDNCYHFESDDVKAWNDAEQYCVGQGGHLASVHNQEQMSFIMAHMARTSWVGLNDIQTENTYVWTDGSVLDFVPWEQHQPDNWHNEDCIFIRGVEHHNAGQINDQDCSHSYPFICMKGKGQGPPPVPPTTGPGWNEKCGNWLPDPFNDYCYLVSSLSMRTWRDARADCVNQGGDLLSITEPFEQSFIHSIVTNIPTGIALWMGGHDSVTEGGWEWSDGSPFRYINWNAGNPDDYYGEDCLDILISNGLWNDDNCDYNRGYICKRRGNTPEPPPPHDGFYTGLACQDSSLVLHCPHNSVISIQSAFYGRKSDTVCSFDEGSTGSCTVEGFLPTARNCDNRPICFLRGVADPDPCPSISKYLEVVYSCIDNVCMRGLGVEDGNVTDAMLSASSSMSGKGPAQARLNGASCWMPSTSSNSWIQVDLGASKKITGVVVQGCPTADFWVTTFKVQTSIDGTQWNDYTEDGGEYPGSVDNTTPETQLLGKPVSVRYIRVLPVAWNGQAGLRLDILGCVSDYAINCGSTIWLDHTTDKRTLHCPAGCAREPYNVYGTVTYRGDSTICAAAIHAGVILNENGGDFTLIKTPGQSFYAGSDRNGITSKQFDGDYSISYTFADGELRCSGPDWYEFGEFCYKPFGDKKTWQGARDACGKEGAELVSIASLAEQSWLESYLYQADTDVWIGLNDLVFPGYFAWADSFEVTFTYWAPGEPNNHMGFNEDCVEMYHQTGRWNDVGCSELNTYICKKPKAHYPIPSVPPTVYGCPPGWGAYAYGCYWFEEGPKRRDEAKAFCEANQATLVHIMDVYEQAHFTAFLAQYTGDWWMGLKGLGGSIGVDYYWDNGLPLSFTNWDREQPDNGQGYCVTMTTAPIAGFWKNEDCTEARPFICEKARNGLSPPTRAPTPPPVGGCADGWTGQPHFRNCYRLFTVDYSNKKSWQAAREDCVARGADLISIHTGDEEGFLAAFTKGKTTWIGLKHNALDGGYQWSDGSAVTHTNWGFGEPNNHEGREECVEMITTNNGTSFWNDINCDAHQDWICMIAKGKTPILPPVPPSPVPAPDCGTNPGWRKNKGICYLFNDTDTVDIYTAMVRCYAEKALLVSILDEDEQSYVVTMVGTSQLASAWIGMHMLGIASGQYAWVDGSPVTYVHWGPGEPNNANGEEQCVQMNRYPGSWNDVNCGRDIAGYVCKKFPGDNHTPVPPTPAWDGNCPEGWMLIGSKCYLVKGPDRNNQNNFKANWTTARKWCKDNGGDLAIIDSHYENDFVASYLRDLVKPVWIGLTDSLHEGGFAWADGVSPVRYTNWADKEPNNHNGKEHCAAMTHTHHQAGRWNDDSCTQEYGWVCSQKKSSGLPPAKNPCKEGYISWFNNCYKLEFEPKSWEAAQVACQEDGGNLASVDMSYDQAFISGAVLQGRPDAWIGLRKKADSDSYTWSDGWPVFFTHWGPGEPTNIKGEGCVAIHSPVGYFYGTWNDTACDVAKPYVCKISSDKPPPTPAPGDGKCLPGWRKYGRYCYLVYDAQKGFSWSEARHVCQEYSADLASIHSRAEIEFIRQWNYTKYHHLWMGLTRDSSYGWAWTDKTSVGYVNWAPGEPNVIIHDGELVREDCVEMYHDGRWNDNNCGLKRGFICQHRQYYFTDDNGGIIIPTDPPPPLGNAGVIAGAIIGAIIFVGLIGGLLYYAVNVRGVKLSFPSLPYRDKSGVGVPTFTNPNFGGGESET
ncbi:macrophage mannose receptor 1-like [Sardina pilchardus]|uniref:macrophage mannose receptor 1-like n=1 Tax=Sardina pilchardus TaxID=27697 RepID=UPI002E111209